MKKVFVLFPLFLIITLIAFLYFSSTAPSTDTSKKVFVINQGENLLTIGTRLHQNKLTRSRYSFVVFTYLMGLNQKIQAGTFYLHTSLNLPSLIQKLAKGGSTDYWLKIIPGTRLEEFSPSPEFTTASTGLEGQLFPDNYLIPELYTPDQILDIIATNFNQKLSQAKLKSTTTLKDKEILILASILEREAKTIESKKMVAGILINRLNLGMPLQVDASIQYAKDSLTHPADYWQPISKSDISIVSPYNTYKNKGLPPGPICNPGLDSLMAAYHPYATDNLFYITGNDRQMHYAKTLSEHNTNIAKYLK